MKNCLNVFLENLKRVVIEEWKIYNFISDLFYK